MDCTISPFITVILVLVGEQNLKLVNNGLCFVNKCFFQKGMGLILSLQLMYSILEGRYFHELNTEPLRGGGG